MAASVADQGLGFTNVVTTVDTSADGQHAGNVTRLNVPDGPYAADKPIVVYYAPQPPPSTPSSSASQTCDPGQDPNCQPNPTTTSSGPGNGQTSRTRDLRPGSAGAGLPGQPDDVQEGWRRN